MAARKMRKAVQESSPAVTAMGGVFACDRCQRRLDLERLRFADAERVDGTINGYVIFEHSCVCEEGVRVTRAWGSFPAFLALFGKMPRLPFRSPFRLTDVPDDATQLVRWQWELDQVVDADEFLLFLDDARNREQGAA